jgi:hypothetical protein
VAQRVLLAVDNDREILTAMQRDLSRRFAADYRIVTADTPRLPSPRSNSVIKSPW